MKSEPAPQEWAQPRVVQRREGGVVKSEPGPQEWAQPRGGTEE